MTLNLLESLLARGDVVLELYGFHTMESIQPAFLRGGCRSEVFPWFFLAVEHSELNILSSVPEEPGLKSFIMFPISYIKGKKMLIRFSYIENNSDGLHGSGSAKDGMEVL